MPLAEALVARAEVAVAAVAVVSALVAVVAAVLLAAEAAGALDWLVGLAVSPAGSSLTGLLARLVL